MRFCTPTLFATLFFFVMMSPTARADFLGLAPGDWNITLQDSSALCGGTDCMGTVHIGPTDATGFDWDFTIAGNTFQFDGPVQNTVITTDGLSSCALEDNTSTAHCDTPDGLSLSFTVYESSTVLILYHAFGDITGVDVWNYARNFASPDGVWVGGPWTATPLGVPEPPSWIYLLIALSALGLWRWLEAKRD